MTDNPPTRRETALEQTRRETLEQTLTACDDDTKERVACLVVVRLLFPSLGADMSITLVDYLTTGRTK